MEQPETLGLKWLKTGNAGTGIKGMRIGREVAKAEHFQICSNCG
jgi:hypothetical protein